MLNGLTEAETMATASVAGLTATRPAAQEPVADEPPYGWHKPCEAPLWHSPVFIVGHEPPSPFTRERAVALGWIPVYTRPAAAPAERGEYPQELSDAALDSIIDHYWGQSERALPLYPAHRAFARAVIDADRAQRVPLTDERTPMDAFENAVRKVGVVAACEWFGHAADSDFTKETIKVLSERAQITPEEGSIFLAIGAKP